MIITYTEDGLLVPDKRAYETMKALCREGKDVSVGSDELIHGLRRLIVEGNVNPADITIRYEDKTFQFDKDAKLEVWHKGFADAWSENSKAILASQIKNQIKQLCD